MKKLKRKNQTRKGKRRKGKKKKEKGKGKKKGCFVLFFYSMGKKKGFSLLDWFCDVQLLLFCCCRR